MSEPICWGLLALIHLVPAIAAIRPSLVTTLYAVGAREPAFILLQHRAFLFAVVVLVCIWAAFDPATRRLAAVAVGVSMGSFLLLYLLHGSPAPLRTIAVADAIGLPALAYVAWRAFAAD